MVKSLVRWLPLAIYQHLLKQMVDLGLLVCCEVPVDSPTKAVEKLHSRFPSEEFLGQTVVRYTVVGASRHFGVEFQPHLPARAPKHFSHRIECLELLYCSQVDPGPSSIFFAAMIIPCTMSLI